MCVPLSVGPSAGQTEGDVQTDVGAAAAGGEMPPPHGVGARQRETQTRRLHEQERRLHRAAGAGEGKVRPPGAIATHTITHRQAVSRAHMVG